MSADNGKGIMLATFAGIGLFWGLMLVLAVLFSELHSCWDLMPG